MLYDEDFLNNLQLTSNRICYAKITALDKDENPLEDIEGVITGGSINVDGKSAMRRSCSVSLVSQNVNISSYLWSLSTKFKLQVGLENLINKNYPSIIWFPQGIFVITSFSSSLSINSYTINISGKDKMCLLNGEVGGIFNSEIDFGKLEIKDTNNNIKLINVPIKKIIREMIHQYGNEPFHNIIINDLDDSGLNLQEYRLDQPLYIWRKANTYEFIDGTLEGEKKVLIEETQEKISIKDIPVFDSLIWDSDYIKEPTPVYLLSDNLNDDEKKDGPYVVARIEYGDTAGYEETELTYPGDLIAKAGETITSVLDKIKTTLAFYEYYYNIEGQFVFEKKSQHLHSTSLLEGSKIITAFNNNPNINNAKNDFTVWGTRRNASGAELPIHMRRAVQKKPTSYTSIEVNAQELEAYNKAYGLNVKPQAHQLYSEKDYDYREIIFQMAKDYRKYNHLDDFELKVITANPDLYPSGKTGYEQYYIDLEGFWRQLYKKNELSNFSPINDTNIYPWNSSNCNITVNPENNAFIIRSVGQSILEQSVKLEKNLEYTVKGFTTANLNNIFIKISGAEIVENYYYWNEEQKTFPNAPLYWNAIDEDLKEELSTVIIPPVSENDNKWHEFYFTIIPYEEDINIQFTSNSNYELKSPGIFDNRYDENGYNTAAFSSPDTLNFAFDLVDTNGDIDQFSVDAIGDRPKVINENKIKAISYREVPWIIFGKTLQENPKTGYRYFNKTGFENAFSISPQGKSAEDEIEELMSQYTYCLESVSITALPIYNLQINSIIQINDNELGISGEYIIDKYTIPLNYNGTMSINATKNIKNIY